MPDTASRDNEIRVIWKENQWLYTGHQMLTCENSCIPRNSQQFS